MAEEESGLLNVTRGRTAGKTRGHGGRLEGQAYQRVFEDRAERADCMNHNRMEK